MIDYEHGWFATTADVLTDNNSPLFGIVGLESAIRNRRANLTGVKFRSYAVKPPDTESQFNNDGTLCSGHLETLFWFLADARQPDGTIIEGADRLALYRECELYPLHAVVGIMRVVQLCHGDVVLDLRTPGE